MRKTAVVLLAQACLALSLAPSAAWAYGGGGGGSASCAEARFYDETPARNAQVSALAEIAVVASDNTDIASLDVQVDGKPVKPDVSKLRSGEWAVKARLPEPITRPGKIRLTLAAKSKEGCETFFPYYVVIGQ
jgi:hypothetical protein